MPDTQWTLCRWPRASAPLHGFHFNVYARIDRTFAAKIFFFIFVKRVWPVKRGRVCMMGKWELTTCTRCVCVCAMCDKNPSETYRISCNFGSERQICSRYNFHWIRVLAFNEWESEQMTLYCITVSCYYTFVVSSHFETHSNGSGSRLPSNNIHRLLWIWHAPWNEIILSFCLSFPSTTVFDYITRCRRQR